jgi:hypothetical protein
MYVESQKIKCSKYHDRPDLGQTHLPSTFSRQIGRFVCINFLLFPFFAQADSLSATITNQLFPWLKYSYRDDSEASLKILLGPRQVLIEAPKVYIDALFPPNNGTDGVMFEGYLPNLEPRITYWSEHPDLSDSPYQSPEKAALRKAIVQSKYTAATWDREIQPGRSA